MDCIKVKSLAEAFQEIEIAKEMIAGNDYVGARSKLLRVRDRFPALDHIDAMIAVCDILQSANLCFLDCEIDWYWILQLTPAARKFYVHSQYDKLGTLLEPIEQFSYPGAASAMQILHEAHSVLSNPDRRSLFDMKRAASFESYGSGSKNSQETPMQGCQEGKVVALPIRSIRDGTNDAGSESSIKQKWSEEDFAPDQIWDVYDVPDSMPGRYVVVNNVVSGSEVCVTFLEPHPVLEEGSYWVEEGLPVVCGSFSAGETTLNLGICHFSHLVKSESDQSTSKLYRIYPKRGEIWAMYKNWNNKWNQSDFTHSQCQVVEIITDFFKESGLIVASLTDVPGCPSFFQRQVCGGFELVRAVPTREMLSFSHKITARNVPGAEDIKNKGITDVLKSSWHLDPNALPPNLSPTLT